MHVSALWEEAREKGEHANSIQMGTADRPLGLRRQCYTAVVFIEYLDLSNTSVTCLKPKPSWNKMKLQYAFLIHSVVNVHASEACSIMYTQHTLISSCMWYTLDSPISASNVAHWKYANEIRHDRWFPLNFLFRHGLTEITEVESRRFSAASPRPLFHHLPDLISFE